MRTAVATGAGAITSGDATNASGFDDDRGFGVAELCGVGELIGVGELFGVAEVFGAGVRFGTPSFNVEAFVRGVWVGVASGAAVTNATGAFAPRCMRTESPAPNASPKTTTPISTGTSGSDAPRDAGRRTRRGGSKSSIGRNIFVARDEPPMQDECYALGAKRLRP